MDGKIHAFGRIASTQHMARRLLEQGVAGVGDAVVADEQTAGHGRFGRSWHSPIGGLYVTIILSPDPLLSLKAGLALVRRLRRAGFSSGVKWPNDVLVGDRKIAGILVEAVGTYSLVGIGLNLTVAPLEGSTCVSEYSDAVNRSEWVLSIVSEINKTMLTPLDIDAYRTACLTLGQHVRLEHLGQQASVEGLAVDVDDYGRLVVLTGDGKRAVSSGECLHVRGSDNDVDETEESS